MDWLRLCAPLVAAFEGCARRVGNLIHPYLDTLAKPAVWTRGYGRTYGITADSPPITPGVALVELETGLQNYAGRVIALSPVTATRPECLAAITSWAWNCGLSAYRASRLRRAINEGRWDDAAELIRKPDTAGGVQLRGLARRRSAERALFTLGAG